MAIAEMTKTITLKINGQETQVREGATIMEAARQVGIRIPTLCFLKEVNEVGACRVCMVEVAGMKNLAAACMFPAADGMEISTNSPRVRKAVKTNLELLLSHHRMDCLSCPRSTNCELQTLAFEYDAQQYHYENTSFRDEKNNIVPAIDTSSKAITRDNSKCILCNRCVAMCNGPQVTGVIGRNGRGFDTYIGSPFSLPVNSTSCIDCGQCVQVCPTAALTEKDDTQKIWDALSNPDMHVVVAPAPSIRAQVGELFGMPMGTNVQGKVVSACRLMGFDGVFDIDTAADMTIMEEANEFIQRFKDNGPFPMFTSCSPGWVKFLEFYYPEYVPNLSSAKSPQGMYGALMKTYYAEKMGIDPKNIFVATIMPCTAKKFEITRGDETPGFNATKYPDVDVVITTVEFARMIKQSAIDFKNLADSEFDPIFGVASGAGHIFGASGGVMEAALRTAADTLTGQSLDALDYKEVRGTAGIKEAEYNLGGQTVRVAVASSPARAKELLDMVKRGEREYHFIEIMGCAGGCVGGGGQPNVPGYMRNEYDIPALRADVLRNIDKNSKYRKSHDNPVVKEIYDSFLGEPGGHKAHELLHTKHEARNVYPPKTLFDYLPKE
ncbi:MAG: [FeFe] hydrogenase, group A [Clostridiales bacterium]|jgi:NADP-reducing hydrogenase subunit HndD|nr:[FeFe] hydrogenase, group A [Clostridiales bacterium]